MNTFFLQSNLWNYLEMRKIFEFFFLEIFLENNKDDRVISASHDVIKRKLWKEKKLKNLRMISHYFRSYFEGLDQLQLVPRYVGIFYPVLYVIVSECSLCVDVVESIGTATSFINSTLSFFFQSFKIL